MPEGSRPSDSRPAARGVFSRPPHPVRVTRIGREAIELVASDTLSGGPMDLKMLVDFGDGRVSDGSYVRIATRTPSDRPALPGTRLRAVFTSLAESDRAHIDRLLEAAVARAAAADP